MSKLNNLYNVVPLLFISGVRFPVSSVQIATSFNTYPKAVIAVPPDYKFYGIGRNDRVPIHIFIKNTFVEKDDDYILIFEGEIESFSYVSTDMARNIVINAAHTMSFMDDVNLNLLTSLDEFAKAQVSGAQLAAANVKGHSEMTMPMSLFMQGLAPVSTDAMIHHPCDFLSNIADFLKDDSLDADNPVHEYFNQHSKDIKFSDRIAKVPYFDDNKASWKLTGADSSTFPLLAALQKGKALAQLNGRAGSGPHQGNIYQFVDYVFSMMEYELSIPNSPTMAGNTLQSIIAKPMFYDALPPACNIIFRSEGMEISTIEDVKHVPTRIRTEDISSAFSFLAAGNASVLKKFGVMNFYPLNDEDLQSVIDPGNKDPMLAVKLLETEKFTGPKIYDTQSPPWLGFLSSAGFDMNDKEFMHQLMKHLYLLKRYEGRSISVTCPYNPYITSGFPGVVFDARDAKFTFIGQVLSVNHTISKTSMLTQVEFGFVRDLNDEELLIENSVKEISDKVTHDRTCMSDIYENLLGCTHDAVDINMINALAEDDGTISATVSKGSQNNPQEAYKFNERKIVTLTEYLNFIGGEINEDMSQITGTLFDERFKGDLVQILVEIRDRLNTAIIY